MLNRPLTLAALANAAVPGLSPAQVEGVAMRPGAPYQVAIVTDEDDNRWQVRSALTTAAGAALDQAERLAHLLGKRLSFQVPHLAGTTTAKNGSSVAVYRQLPGQPLGWRDLVPRSEEARSLGRALAELHDIDPRVYDEAGLPSYDADAYRSRRLSELDRAASTGHVPPRLLGRWERALEEVSLWRFATTPTHGALHDGDVLVEDGDVVAVDSWDTAAVSDPASDFAVLSLMASPEAVDTVVEAYAQSRRERPDTHLERRIRLASELRRVSGLMEAANSDDDLLVDRRAAALRRLDEERHDDESLLPPPVRRRTAGGAPVVETPPPPEVDPADIEVVEVRESNDEDETLEIPQVEGDDEDAYDDEGIEDAGTDVELEDAGTEDAGTEDAATEDAATEDEPPASRDTDETQPIRRKTPDPDLHAG
ncbi:phosphotransferase [Luteipulveratus mongoliensis]|uniref:phosphotransferase n=1 Tax=Luteipulveratus mongoliensis TaxID=571913 RepID=UPI000697ABB2|nr:phosphotransferase [Luteipulveratus mongoliensis]